MGVTAPHTRHRGTAARAAPSTPRRARLSPRSPRVRPLARTCVERPQALRVHRRVERPVPQHVLRRRAVVAARVAAAAARVLLVGLQAHAVQTAGKAKNAAVSGAARAAQRGAPRVCHALRRQRVPLGHSAPPACRRAPHGAPRRLAARQRTQRPGRHAPLRAAAFRRPRAACARGAGGVGVSRSVGSASGRWQPGAVQRGLCCAWLRAR